MKTAFIARRIRIYPSTQEIVQTKLSKLERFLPRTVQAHVVVQREKNSISVEVALAGRQRTWKAAASGPDQWTAAQEVMDRIAAQVKKSKALVKEEKKRSGPSVRKPEGWPETAAEPRAASGPRRESAAARQMFEEDALTAFQASGGDLLVYRDLGADAALRILYRRRDGRVGLVVPE
jgi:ribosomal subunit interface protein